MKTHFSWQNNFVSKKHFTTKSQMSPPKADLKRFLLTAGCLLCSLLIFHCHDPAHSSDMKWSEAKEIVVTSRDLDVKNEKKTLSQFIYISLSIPAWANIKSSHKMCRCSCFTRSDALLFLVIIKNLVTLTN